MANSKDVIVYIHGITPAAQPKVHRQDYDALEALLKAELSARDKPYPEHRIDIEWGFEAPGISTNDRMLAPTERALLEKVEDIIGRHSDPTLNPLRLAHHAIRKNFMLGVADMFYYASEDGKAEVRQNVLNTLLDRLPPLAQGESYAWTIVAHSSGAAVMHDLLFIVFGGGSKSFLTGAAEQKLQSLQEYARQGKVFIRCFITLGAPITPLIFRSGKMMGKIYNSGRLDGKLDLDGIGIRVEPNGRRSRWLNFWDKDDVIGFPVAFLYHNPDNLVEDFYLDIGDVFPLVHLAYWSTRQVAAVIAERY